MSINLRFFGNNEKVDNGNITLEIRPNTTYEEIYDMASVSGYYPEKLSIQATSTVALELKIEYSLYYHITKSNEDKEVWFEYKTISIPAGSNFIEHMTDVPHCKFLKYTVTPSSGDYIEYATIASLFS